MDKNEDLERFLKNVDEISDIVIGLKSSDADVLHKALDKADSLLAAMDEPCRTKVNKTKINTNPPQQPDLGLQSESPENFMKVLEKDAEERRLRRVAREKKATAHKDEGNEAYNQGDYETAVRYYSDGLAELQDMQPLYTNRAQAFIKLGKYEEAISDCEWALKCNESCIKAYLLMGKAYLASKKYNEARNCFEMIKEIEPRRDKMVREYLSQVHLDEEREIQEKNAMQDLDKGDKKARRVPHLLEKLSKPGQMPIYYHGGVEILSQAVTDCTDQTLFRLHNGFSVICSNGMVRSCLLQDIKDPDSQQMCVSVLKLWRAVCKGNDENQKMLMSCKVTRQSIVLLVTSTHAEAQKECLALLDLLTQKPHGRCSVIENLNVHLLARNLMACAAEPSQQQENIAVTILENLAAENKYDRGPICVMVNVCVQTLDSPLRLYYYYGLLSNYGIEGILGVVQLATEPHSSQQTKIKSQAELAFFFFLLDRFCKQLRSVATESVIAPFTSVLKNISMSNQHVLPSLISAAGCLARDDVIRRNFAHDPDCWKAFLIAIKQCSVHEYKEVLYPLLGLIINLSTVSSTVIQECAVSLCDCCLDLLRNTDGEVITRATGVLSTVLPQSSEAVQHVVQGGVVRTMRKLLKGKGQAATKYAIKTLTVCTAASQLAREELVKWDKNLSTLRHLLASSCDEMVTGNAALCLAHCLELKGIASSLLGTDILLLLLRHAAGDAKRTAVKQNAAIALGKLCRTEPRYLNELRRLHGLEILHSCMKLVS